MPPETSPWQPLTLLYEDSTVFVFTVQAVHNLCRGNVYIYIPSRTPYIKSNHNNADLFQAENLIKTIHPQQSHSNRCILFFNWCHDCDGNYLSKCRCFELFNAALFHVKQKLAQISMYCLSALVNMFICFLVVLSKTVSWMCILDVKSS